MSPTHHLPLHVPFICQLREDGAGFREVQWEVLTKHVTPGNLYTTLLLLSNTRRLQNTEIKETIGI